MLVLASERTYQLRSGWTIPKQAGPPCERCNLQIREFPHYANKIRVAMIRVSSTITPTLPSRVNEVVFSAVW